MTPAQTAYTHMGKEHIVRTYAPASFLTAELNRLAPGSRVLYPPDDPSGATLRGTPLYLNWYAPTRASRFAAVRDAQAMASFLSEEKVDFVILNMSNVHAYGTPLTLLSEHLARYGITLAAEGPFVLYQLGDAPPLYRQIFNLRSAVLKLPGASDLLLQDPNLGIEATTQSKELAVFQTQRALQARYSVRLRCPSDVGFFIAQINWDVGAPYYRLVACRADEFSFTEAIPIPLGVRKGMLHVTVRDTTSAQIEDLQVEIH